VNRSTDKKSLFVDAKRVIGGHKSKTGKRTDYWVWCLTPLSTNFSYIVGVSFIGGGKRSAQIRAAQSSVLCGVFIRPLFIIFSFFVW
jgi:uncharacterized membrane protein YhaH (DUF805 family)